MIAKRTARPRRTPMIATEGLSRAEKLELAQTLWRELADSPSRDEMPWNSAALDEAMQAPNYRAIDFQARKTAASTPARH